LGALEQALSHLARALAARPGAPVGFRPFLPAAGACLKGRFEVRSADGRVRRHQEVALALPTALSRAFSHLAPEENLAVDMGTHALTLWAPQELIELQVGYRWHGFSGKRMPEWDERFVVFAEDGGDPLALRLDEPDGPVWLSHRGEGRHDFFEAASDLAGFFEALALFVEAPGAELLAARLSTCFGERASSLWLWKQLVSRTDALR
jgi:hypothetical protein